MLFDVRTVLALTAVNLFTMAIAMSLVMGRNLSPAARLARASLVAQATGWAAIVASGSFLDMPLSVLAIASGGVSNWLMHRALGHWLGPRPYGPLMTALTIALPLGYAASFHSYPLRVGWANILLAMQFLLVALVALRAPDAPLPSLGWRRLMALCYGSMAVLTLGRGVMGGWYTELYPTFATAHPVNVAAQVAANVSLVLTMLAVLVAWRREVEIALEAQAHTDALTGLLNRRGWMKQSEVTLAQAQREGWQAGLLMLDLDHFKRVNDVHGHETGDQALQILGQAIRQSLRVSDSSGRLGGEEFVLLLNRVTAEDAMALDRRLRDTFQQLAAERLHLNLDFSSGLALLNPQQPDGLRQALIAADGAMYQAKAQGRGQLCLATATAHRH